MLKQCGQVATIFSGSARVIEFSVSTFCMPSIWNRNSLPSRRAGSPRARLARAEHRELDTGHVQQFGERPGHLLRAVLQRARAADPEQVLDVGVELRARHGAPDLERQPVHPLVAAVVGHAPRVALVLEVAQHDAGLGRERRLDQHLVAAHVDDVVDVLDVDRALLDARAARGARPQHVGVDHAAAREVTDERTRGLLGAGARDAREARLGDVVTVLAALELSGVTASLLRPSLPPRRYGAFANR